MQARKIILPAISVGLIVTSRPATASTIDLGVVAQSLVIDGTIPGAVGATPGSYTLGGLQYVGPDLSQVINGQTVSEILTTDIGAPNAGTLTFSFGGPQGASGNFTFTGSYPAAGGTVALSPNTVTMGLTSCTPDSSTAALPGCAAGGGAQIQADPYAPAGLAAALRAGQIVGFQGNFVDVGLTITTGTLALDLGSVGNTDYHAEVLETTVSAAAAPSPEPASWSMAAFGAAVLTWLRRRPKRG
jgi:hypothetical protein